MRRSPLLLTLAALTCAAAAHGQPSTLSLVGAARGGASFAPAERLGWGPAAGVDLGVGFGRLYGLELGLTHARYFPGGGAARGTAAHLGLQYRVDATWLAAYVLLGLEAQLLEVAERRQLSPGAALGIGFWAPLRGPLLWGGEARYHLSPSGAFPIRQGYFARVGWRLGGD